MATVKIILDNDETVEGVEDDLIKAIADKNGNIIENTIFDDPLINLLSDTMDDIYIKNYIKMMNKIMDVLKE